MSVSLNEVYFSELIWYITPAEQLWVTNVGGGTLTFNSFGFTLNNQYFRTLANNCQGRNVGPGQSCDIAIDVYAGETTLVPPGAYNDTFIINSNAGTVSIALHGFSPDPGPSEI